MLVILDGLVLVFQVALLSLNLHNYKNLIQVQGGNLSCSTRQTVKCYQRIRPSGGLNKLRNEVKNSAAGSEKLLVGYLRIGQKC
ncbi:hypothetical protein AgCh_019165 [Apium graveolens]